MYIRTQHRESRQRPAAHHFPSSRTQRGKTGSPTPARAAPSTSRIWHSVYIGPRNPSESHPAQKVPSRNTTSKETYDQEDTERDLKRKKKKENPRCISPPQPTPGDPRARSPAAPPPPTPLPMRTSLDLRCPTPRLPTSPADARLPTRTNFPRGRGPGPGPVRLKTAPTPTP